MWPEFYSDLTWISLYTCCTLWTAGNDLLFWNKQVRNISKLDWIISIWKMNSLLHKSYWMETYYTVHVLQCLNSWHFWGTHQAVCIINVARKFQQVIVAVLTLLKPYSGQLDLSTLKNKRTNSNQRTNLFI